MAHTKQCLSLLQPDIISHESDENTEKCVMPRQMSHVVHRRHHRHSIKPEWYKQILDSIHKAMIQNDNRVCIQFITLIVDEYNKNNDCVKITTKQMMDEMLINPQYSLCYSDTIIVFTPANIL